MRMWNVPVSEMCDKHLRGEHVEMHMFVGSIIAGKSLNGFAANGLINTDEIDRRHDDLSLEMVTRGGRHESYFTLIELDQVEHAMVALGGHLRTVHPIWNRWELARRCAACRARMGTCTGVPVPHGLPAHSDTVAFDHAAGVWVTSLSGIEVGRHSNKMKALKPLEAARAELFHRYKQANDINWTPPEWR